MKKKWKGSMGAKAGAWIGITLCGCIFLAGVLGAAVMSEGDVYDYSEEQIRKKAYESIAEHYAIRALDNMENPKDGKWQNTYFRYGIIKADEIDGLNLNDESIYVERNFNYLVEADRLYTTRYEIGEDTVFNYSGTLFGGYKTYSRAHSYLINSPLYQICYNKENGIFYYEGSSEFYPVRNVEFQDRNYDGQVIRYFFQYDFDRKMYRNMTYTGTAAGGQAPETEGDTDTKIIVEEITEEQRFGSSADSGSAAAVPAEPASGDRAEAAGTEEMIQPENTAEIVDTARTEPENMAYSADAAEVLAGEYITFNMFDDTAVNYNTWDEVWLDGYARRAAAENELEGAMVEDEVIRLLDSGYFTQKPVTWDRDYELVGKILHINRPAEEDTETYWVVAELPESVGFGWNSDLFVQANTLITLAYTFRYSIYLILLASFSLGIFFFGFLVSAAGHRRDSDEIVAGWLDKMPFDVYLGFAGLAELFLALVAKEMTYYFYHLSAVVVFFTVIIAMCWVLLLSILTFAVRVKRGKWWHNTVVWWVLHGIFLVCRTLIQKISFLYKAILLAGGISIMELIAVFLFGYRRQSMGMFLLLEKMILIPPFLLMVLHMQELKQGGEALAAGDLNHKIDTAHMLGEFKEHGENLNGISEGMSLAVNERMKSEHFKTELITNVSHDIKTPLTSIINYVDLLEKEELENETAKEYLEVLKRQSARLKKLIEDLMEASKASTGNLAVNLERLEAGVSMVQIVGEFEEKMKANELTLLIGNPEEPVYIRADSRHFWRVIDNLMNNICKYAQPATRVYIDLEQQESSAVITFRNTSRYPLNISSEELMERFVRGDSSRNTEGSGLGISIAKSLMELMGGSLELYVDGDLFKVVLKFPEIVESEKML